MRKSNELCESQGPTRTPEGKYVTQHVSAGHLSYCSWPLWVSTNLKSIRWSFPWCRENHYLQTLANKEVSIGGMQGKGAINIWQFSWPRFIKGAEGLASSPTARLHLHFYLRSVERVGWDEKEACKDVRYSLKCSLGMLWFFMLTDPYGTWHEGGGICESRTGTRWGLWIVSVSGVHPREMQKSYFAWRHKCTRTDKEKVLPILASSSPLIIYLII